MRIFQKKSTAASENNNKSTSQSASNKKPDKTVSPLPPIMGEPGSFMFGEKTQNVPVLTEVVEVMPSGVTVEAVSKLIAECERYKVLLTQWEQREFPEIVARCQAAMQTDLEQGATHLVNNVSEKMSRILRAELKVAMMQALSEQ